MLRLCAGLSLPSGPGLGGLPGSLMGLWFPAGQIRPLWAGQAFVAQGLYCRDEAVAQAQRLAAGGDEGMEVAERTLWRSG